MDLYRQPGHRPGHLRDYRRGRAPAFRRRSLRQVDPDRRARRDGRRAAARRHHGRRQPDRRRVPAEPDRVPPEDPLSRHRGGNDRRSARHRRTRARRREAGLGRTARQRRRDLSRDARARHPPRRCDRPDVGARPGERLSAGRLDARGMGRTPRARPGRRRRRGQAVDGAPGRGHARLPPRGHPGARLRQQHPPDGVRGRAEGTRSTSPASSRPMSARCSAAARGRSAGPRCRAIRRTSTAPTRR